MASLGGKRRGIRVALCAGAVLAAALAAPSALAVTYHYTVTIEVTGATQTGAADPEAGGSQFLSGSGQASWHGVWNVAIEVDRSAQTAQTGFRAVGENSYKQLTGTATGSYSSHVPNSVDYDCQYSVSQVPAGVLLYGSGLDTGRVFFMRYSYRETGKFGFALVNPNPAEFPPFRASCSGPSVGFGEDRLNRSVFVGIDTYLNEERACLLGSVATPIQFPVSRLGEEHITFNAPFSGPFQCTPFGSGTVQGTYKVDLQRVCLLSQGPPPRFGLNGFEASEVKADQQDFLRRYVDTLRRAIAALQRDERLHPDRRARDEAALARLRGLLAGAERARGLSGRAQGLNPDETKLLERATCGLLNEAKDSLTDYVKEHGTKNQKNAVAFIDKLGTLASVLDGRVAPTSPEAKTLLASNLIALGERLGGADAGKLTGKGVTLFKVLSGSLSKKELDATLRKEVEDLTKRLAGKKAAELAHQVLILRDVLTGNAGDAEQFEVLKESVVGLATRLLGEGVLDTPHVRAAMLGFELGRPFGQRIAADLKLIARKVLARECIQALAKQQGVGPGEVDYTKKTQTFIPVHKQPSDPTFEFQGWICKIRPEGHVGGIEGGVVEAISPVKRYLGGLITTGGESVFFDPQFAS